MADNLTSVEAEAILKTFQKFDANGDGFLSKEELKSYYIKLYRLDEQTAENHLNEFIKTFDANKDGRISYQEFLHFVVSQPIPK